MFGLENYFEKSKYEIFDKEQSSYVIEKIDYIPKNNRNSKFNSVPSIKSNISTLIYESMNNLAKLTWTLISVSGMHDGKTVIFLFFLSLFFLNF